MKNDSGPALGKIRDISCDLDVMETIVVAAVSVLYGVADAHAQAIKQLLVAFVFSAEKFARRAKAPSRSNFARIICELDVVLAE